MSHPSIGDELAELYNEIEELNKQNSDMQDRLDKAEAELARLRAENEKLTAERTEQMRTPPRSLNLIPAGMTKEEYLERNRINGGLQGDDCHYDPLEVIHHRHGSIIPNSSTVKPSLTVAVELVSNPYASSCSIN